MVHRDIKPGNLMVSGVKLQGAAQSAAPADDRFSALPTRPYSPTAHHSTLTTHRLKILDFGLSRFISETVAVETLTLSGTLVGTPDYIAPEQALTPRGADIRADIYSLGCTLYHLLAGTPPFPGGTVMQKLIAHREQAARSLTEAQPDLPAGLVQVVERMLAKEPARRFQTPAEVANALTPFVPPEELGPARQHAGPDRRWLWPGLLAAAVILIAVAGAAWFFAAGALDPVGSVKPPPPPPTMEQLRQEARERAITWLRENNGLDPNGPFIPDRIKQIDNALVDGSGCIMEIGGDAMKSGQPVLLALRNGQFVVYELTAEQARHARVKPRAVYYQQIPSEKATYMLPPAVQLSDLRIEDGAALPSDRKMTGSVVYRTLREIKGDFGLRIIWHAGGLRHSNFHYLRHDLGPGPGTLSFKIGTVGRGDKTNEGPLTVFVELCTFTDRKQPEVGMTVVSNTATALVIVVPPAEEKK
jgi:hypothetical protein